MSFIKNFFRRRTTPVEDVAQSEVLSSVLIPSGHYDRFIRPAQREAFFAPYLEYIGHSLEEVYGTASIARRQIQENANTVACTFVDTPFLRVEYRFSPLEELDASPSTFYGELRIKQPTVELHTAGRLHRKLLDAHPGQGFTFSYCQGDEPGFQVFLTKGVETLCRGDTLLRRMGMDIPDVGLSYMEHGTSRAWRRVSVDLRQ